MNNRSKQVGIFVIDKLVTSHANFENSNFVLKYNFNTSMIHRNRKILEFTNKYKFQFIN